MPIVRIGSVLRLACPLVLALTFCVIAQIYSDEPVDNASSQTNHIPQEIGRLRAPAYINGLAWNFDGSRLAALSNYGTQVTVWQSQPWKKISEFRNPGASYMQNSFAFLADGSVLTTPKLVFGKEHLCSLVQWNPDTGQRVREIPDVCYPDRTDDVGGITDTYTVSKDGSLIAGIGGKVGVMIFDSQSGRFIKALAIPSTPLSPDTATSLAFSPDNRTLAIGTGHGYVHFYDLRTSALTRSFQAYESSYYINSLAFNRDGQYLATGKYKGVNVLNPNGLGVTIWRTDDASLVVSLPVSTTIYLGKVEALGVFKLAWSPISDVLAVGDGRSLRLWRMTGRSPKLLLNKSMASGPYSLAYSPQGTLAAADNNTEQLAQARPKISPADACDARGRHGAAAGDPYGRRRRNPRPGAYVDRPERQPP
jgi:WD40 repeat protein